MALLIMVDEATTIREQTNRRPFHLGISERERERERKIRGLSSIFGAARKYGSGWIGLVILIGWKCSATLTVKLNYAPNKNSIFFLLQYIYIYIYIYICVCVCVCVWFANEWFVGNIIFKRTRAYRFAHS